MAVFLLVFDALQRAWADLTPAAPLKNVLSAPRAGLRIQAGNEQKINAPVAFR
jgi:hypothetical protein